MADAPEKTARAARAELRLPRIEIDEFDLDSPRARRCGAELPTHPT